MLLFQIWVDIRRVPSHSSPPYYRKYYSFRKLRQLFCRSKEKVSNCKKNKNAQQLQVSKIISKRKGSIWKKLGVTARSSKLASEFDLPEIRSQIERSLLCKRAASTILIPTIFIIYNLCHLSKMYPIPHNIKIID